MSPHTGPYVSHVATYHAWSVPIKIVKIFSMKGSYGTAVVLLHLTMRKYAPSPYIGLGVVSTWTISRTLTHSHSHTHSPRAPDAASLSPKETLTFRVRGTNPTRRFHLLQAAGGRAQHRFCAPGAGNCFPGAFRPFPQT